MSEELSVPYAVWLASYLSMLAMACVVDGTRGRIPNPVVFAGAAVALAVSSTPGGVGFSSALAGLAIAGVASALLRQAGGLGGGDVKLLAASGAFVGFPAVLPLLLATALAGGVLSAVAAARSGKVAAVIANLRRGAQQAAGAIVLEHRMPAAADFPATAAPPVPYALAIAAGALFQLVFWSPIR